MVDGEVFIFRCNLLLVERCELPGSVYVCRQKGIVESNVTNGDDVCVFFMCKVLHTCTVRSYSSVY